MGNVSPSYKGHRYPAEVISHCVWLYHRFPLGFRDVEELMMERGVVVSYDTVRRWCAKFGQAYARELRRRLPRAGDKWHLDEVFIKINSEQKYLWRAVDQDGTVLHILVLCTPWPSPRTPRRMAAYAAGFRWHTSCPARRSWPVWAAAFLAPLHDLPKTPVDVTRLAVTFPRSAVARLLHISRTTVAAHCRRAEEALGVDLSDVRARATVDLALSLTGPQSVATGLPHLAPPHLEDLLRTGLAVDWAESFLRPLHGARPSTLHITVSAWIDADTDARRTAARGGLSRNTVRAHLRAAERLLNRDRLTTGSGIHDLVHALGVTGGRPHTALRADAFCRSP